MHRGSPAYVHGCWIGLKADNSGVFDWINPSYVGSSTIFLDWRRGEPNNHTYSDGIPTNGELCGKIIAWQEDPLIEEQGSWNDESCNVPKPFICQIYANTNRFSITSTGAVNLQGGELVGGYLYIEHSGSNITQFTASLSSMIKIDTHASGTNINQLTLSDGAELVIGAPLVYLLPQAFIGESLPSPLSVGMFSGLMQPKVTTLNGTVIEARTGIQTINARVVMLGSIQVDPNANVNFLQVNIIFILL